MTQNHFIWPHVSSVRKFSIFDWLWRENLYNPPQKTWIISPSRPIGHMFILDALYIFSWSTKLIGGQLDVREWFLIIFMEHKRIARALDDRKINFFQKKLFQNVDIWVFLHLDHHSLICIPPYPPSSLVGHKFIMDELYICSWWTKLIQCQLHVIESFSIIFMYHNCIVRALDGRKINFS